MTYPTGDDRAVRDERLHRDREERAETARAGFERTGICARRILGTDPVAVSCPVCLHAETLHPGVTNPDPDLTGCVVCHLKALAAGRDRRLELDPDPAEAYRPTLDSTYDPLEPP